MDAPQPTKYGSLWHLPDLAVPPFVRHLAY